MDGVEIAIAAFGLFLAGLLKGTTGIGYSTCALPFLVATVGLNSAMSLVIAPAIASNVALLLTSGGAVCVARRFWPFYAAIMPGIALGVALFAAIDSRVAAQALGALTIAYCVLALARPEMSISSQTGRLLAVPAGFVNGFLTGLTGAQVLPLLPYMMALRLPPDLLVQAVNVAVTLASVALAVVMLSSGLASTQLLLLSVLGVLPAMFGVSAGVRVRRLLGDGQFRTISLAMLAALGLALLMQSTRFAGQCPEHKATAALQRAC